MATTSRLPRQLAGDAENLAGSDPARFLREWERILVNIDGRGAALTVVLAVAAGVEPAARRLWEQAQAQRLEGARSVVARLVELGRLREGLTAEDAADLAGCTSTPRSTPAL